MARLAQDPATADPAAWIVADNADPATPERLIAAVRDRFGRLDGALISVATLPDGLEVISASHTDVQTTLLVRTSGPVLDPAWTISEVGLEDLVLAYMSQAAGRRRRDSHRHLEVQK